jgi:hypothetical protein
MSSVTSIVETSQTLSRWPRPGTLNGHLAGTAPAGKEMLSFILQDLKAYPEVVFITQPNF